MGGVPIRPALLAYLQHHNGVLVAADVAKDLGESRERVTSGLSNLYRDGGGLPGLVRVGNGVYTYYPSTKQGKAKDNGAAPAAAPVDVPALRTPAGLFEYVGTTEAIGTIVRGEDGKLYRLEAL